MSQKTNKDKQSGQTEPHEPDYRFTLANERTFLAWIRTALALLAGAVAFVHLIPDLGVPGARKAIGATLAAVSIAAVAGAALRWHGAQKAMRRDAALPSTLMPWLLAAAIIVVSIALIATMLVYGVGDVDVG